MRTYKRFHQLNFNRLCLNKSKNEKNRQKRAGTPAGCGALAAVLRLGAICRAKHLAGGVHPRADCESDALKQVGVKA